VNKVLLTGRLTRDPEMRSLASGKAVTQFSVATNEYIGQGKEKAEYHNIVTWVTRPLGRTRHPRPASRA
jgi:single-strand DNA-binding protein